MDIYCDHIERVGTRFSSPLGDFVFYIASILSSDVSIPEFSSPLGDFVFYIAEEIVYYNEELNLFSSPLGDFVFYI